MNNIQIQQALAQLGYYLGKIDGLFGDKSKEATKKFQADHGLVVDGKPGPQTQLALTKTITAASGEIPPVKMPVEGPIPVADWMPDANMKGIVVHWTAGHHKASSNDRAHYHFLIEDDGKLIRGIPSVDLNSLPKAKKGYAAHTLNCNTGFIGVSLCCMANAIESPFKAGDAPMTRTQWQKLPSVLAQLCKRYNIKVSPTTLLSHAEVSKNLGIPQKGKWDISRLAFDSSIVGAKACGDIMRSATQALL